MKYKLIQIIEAALLSASRPLSILDLQKLFDEPDLPSKDKIKECLEEPRRLFLDL